MRNTKSRKLIICLDISSHFYSKSEKCDIAFQHAGLNFSISQTYGAMSPIDDYWINIFKDHDGRVTPILSGDDEYAKVDLNYHHGALIDGHLVRSLYISLNGLISFDDPFRFPNPITAKAVRKLTPSSNIIGLLETAYDVEEMNNTMRQNGTIPAFSSIIAPFWSDMVAPHDRKSGVLHRCYNNRKLLNKPEKNNFPPNQHRRHSLASNPTTISLDLGVGNITTARYRKNKRNVEPTSNTKGNKRHKSNETNNNFPPNLPDNSENLLSKNFDSEDYRDYYIEDPSELKFFLNRKNYAGRLANDYGKGKRLEKFDFSEMLPDDTLDDNNDICKTEIPLDIRRVIAYLIKSSENEFDPLFTLITTWSNMTSFSTQNTMTDFPTIYNFQSILVVESDQLHILFHYKKGGMINLKNQMITDLSIGYSLFGDKDRGGVYFMPNISLVPDAANIADIEGNTGLTGIYHYKIKFNSDFGLKCHESLNIFHSHNITLDNKLFEECPCTLGQAKADFRYIVNEDNCATLKVRLSFRRGRKKLFKFTPVCCYDKRFHDTLMPTFPSRYIFDQELENSNSSQEIWNNCCGGSTELNTNGSQLCQLYHQVQASMTCSRYNNLKFGAISGHSYIIPLDSPTGYFYNGHEGVYRILESQYCIIQGVYEPGTLEFQGKNYSYPNIQHLAFRIASSNFVDMLYDSSKPFNIDVYWNAIEVNEFPVHKNQLVIERLEEEKTLKLTSYLYTALISSKNINGLQLELYVSDRCFNDDNHFSKSLLTLEYDLNTGLFISPKDPNIQWNASVDFNKFQKFGNSSFINRNASIIKVDLDESDIHILVDNDSESINPPIQIDHIIPHKALLVNYSLEFAPVLNNCKYKDSVLYYQCLMEVLIWHSHHGGNTSPIPQNHIIVERLLFLIHSEAVALRMSQRNPILKFIGPNLLEVIPNKVNIFYYDLSHAPQTSDKFETTFTNGYLNIYPNGTFTYEPFGFGEAYLAIFVMNDLESTVYSIYRPSIALSQCNESASSGSNFNDEDSHNENGSNESTIIPSFLWLAPFGVFIPVPCKCEEYLFGPNCDTHLCHFNPCFKGAPCEGFKPTNLKTSKSPQNASGSHYNEHSSVICPPCPTYAKGDGMKCEDIDECQNLNSSCVSHKSICINHFPYYQCRCNVGYEPSDAKMTCEAISVCGRPEFQCDQGKVCRNKYHNTDSVSASCVCPEGTKLVDDKCIGVNECLEAEICGENMECIDHDIGYECKCVRGYRKLPKTNKCIDYDECDRMDSIYRNNCSQKCVNEHGSYLCSCHDPFVSNSYDSSKPLEDCVPKAACDFSQQCSFPNYCAKVYEKDTCFCPPGFEMKNENICTDIDECKTSNQCQNHHQATCINTQGSYYCTCHPGFLWNSFNLTCEDIDECSPLNMEGDCVQPAFCANLPGSHRCDCPLTFEIDPKNYSTCTKKLLCDGQICPHPSHCQAVWKPIRKNIDLDNPKSYTVQEECGCNLGYYIEEVNGSINCAKSPINIILNFTVDSINRHIDLSNLTNIYSWEFYSVSKEIKRPIDNAMRFLFKDMFIGSQIFDIKPYPKIMFFNEIQPHSLEDENYINQLLSGSLDNLMNYNLNVSMILMFRDSAKTSGLLNPDDLNFLPNTLSRMLWSQSPVQQFDSVYLTRGVGRDASPMRKKRQLSEIGYKNYSVSPTRFLPTTAIKVFPNSLAAQDLNECNTEMNVCPPDVTDCLNIFGGFICVCKPGYRKALHWSNPKVHICQDIDECKENLDKCSSWGALCTNTPGGYLCQCPTGFGTLMPGQTKCIAYIRDRYWRNFAITTAIIMGTLFLLALALLAYLCFSNPSAKKKLFYNNSSPRYVMDSASNDTTFDKIPRPRVSTIPYRGDDDDRENSEVKIKSPNTLKSRYSYDNPVAYQGTTSLTHF
ncbi:unnamed protein product [Gordionus sp. m RMFG-2023]